ncbi:MAG: hypothetical protein LBT65_03495, partial [Synergistaceae bacterium]|nr:hypothetical protein [Synergistaceae bacterium]
MNIRGQRLKRRLRTLGLGCILPILFLAAWEYLGRAGIVNQSILPYPSRLWDCLKEMIVAGRLQKHLMVSAGRVIRGFALGSGMGLFAGVLCGLSGLWNALLAS